MSRMSPTTRQILITNDDGVRAPGLAALARAAQRLGEVTIVAPDREQSGASHALTIRQPVRIERVAERVFAVEGTPTDCVNLAFFKVLERSPDLVLSGINAGYNLGEDVTYSGTVAGALEARILGVPSVAVSTSYQARPEQMDQAARIAVDIAKLVLERGLPMDAFLNVNVPPAARGHRVTRQGRRGLREGLASAVDPNGRELYWIGLVQPNWVPDPGADHQAVSEGIVSITPLHADLTFHRVLPVLEGWPFPGQEQEPR